MIIIKEIISDKEAISLIVIFTYGSALIIGTGQDAKNDTWFAILLGMLFGMIVATMYSRILYNFPQKDLFDINIILFGKIIGNIINIIFIFYAFHLGALVTNNFSEFTSTVGLPDTPKIVPILFATIISIWSVKAGFEVLGRFGSVLILLYIFTVVLTLGLSIHQMNIDNIRPFMYEGIVPIMRGTFSAFSFPFAENVIFLMLFSNLKNKNSSFKVFWIGLFMAGITLSILAARNTMFLGTDVLDKNYFPAYVVVSGIKVGSFIQRIETTIVIAFLVAGFIKVSCCNFAACKGIAKLLGVEDYRFISTPVILMILSFSFLVYNNITETIDWAPHVYPIYAFLFQVILPIIILIAAEIKMRKTQKKGDLQ
ncbi:GerAB/ArcD/ProY family transporter [Candidatus Clostridium radicumherbarum]|uniref:Endospore germination permease n=1 Tax=Candidatus Clostridium radicumherbarum TaxID=3381662 RepID=A0ABW8TV60_9CLOT